MLAKKAAALEAIKILYKEKELDEHLKPVTQRELDSDEEDGEKMDNKRRQNAGTMKRAMYYRNEVSMVTVFKSFHVYDLFNLMLSFRLLVVYLTVNQLSIPLISCTCF